MAGHTPERLLLDDAVRISKDAEKVRADSKRIKTDYQTEAYKKAREEADARARKAMLDEINTWIKARDYYVR